MKISKNLNFSEKIFNSNFVIRKKKPRLINSSSKKNLYIFNYFKNIINFKKSYVLVNIKKKISNFYVGVFKTAQGFIFLSKFSNGIFLGDILINFSLPLNYLNTGSSLSIWTLIKNLPIYSICSNITSTFNSNKSYLATSSGTYCQLLEIKNNLSLAILKVPSGKKIFINYTDFTLTGRNNNINKKYEIEAKASFNILLGKNPKVRGVAKNPVDHPHGGRTKTVQPEVSPWGWVTKHSH